MSSGVSLAHSPTVGAVDIPEEVVHEAMGAADSGSQASRSSSEISSPAKSEPSQLSEENLEWFVQPGNRSRAHIVKTVNKARAQIPFCREDKPFFRFSVHAGSCIDSAATWHGGVCDSCIARMPQPLANKFLSAILLAGKTD